MPDNLGRSLPVDPRIVREIASSPRMAAEQGAGFMQSWGGPGAYVQMAHSPQIERMVYYAVAEGVTDPSQLEVVTGLPREEINRAVSSLKRKGLVQEEEDK